MTTTPERAEFYAWLRSQGIQPTGDKWESARILDMQLGWDAAIAARQSAPESCAKVSDCTESLCMQANRCKHTLPPQPQRLCVEQSEDRRDAWIPVRERLPEEGEWVVGIVITEHSYGSWIEQWESGEPVGYMTHWLPAPSTAIAALKA